MPNKFHLQHMKSSFYRAVQLGMAVLLISALIFTGVNLSVPAFGAADTQQSDSVASVEANGTTKYYSNFVEAWNAAQEYDSAKLSVIAQTMLHKSYNNAVTLSKGNVTLDMGGTLGGAALFLFSDYKSNFIPITINGGTLTIAAGLGEGAGDEACIKVNRGGTLNIADGSLQVEGKNSNLISSEGTVNVTGGQVNARPNAATTSVTSAIVISSSGTLNISDGVISAPNTNSVCVNTTGGTVNMTGGKITGSNILIDRWGGTISISGGELLHINLEQSQGCTINLRGIAMKDILSEGKAFKLGDSYISADDLEKNTYTIPFKSKLTIADATCRITGQPSGAEYTYGDKNPADLSVSAEVIGSGTLSYQWRRSDTADIVSTSASCPADLSKPGTFQYYCVVSCNGYSVNSDKVTVTVKPCLHESLNADHSCAHCGTAAVALMNSKYYFSIADAVAAANGGARIELLRDYTESIEIRSGDFVFAGGSHTLTATENRKAINVIGGSLIIESGTIASGVSISNGTAADLVKEGCAFKLDGSWVNDLSQTSLDGTITVHKAPVVITKQPEGGSLIFNNSKTLSVTVSPNSSEPVTYQWYNGTTAIDGATSAEYTFSGSTAGEYALKCAVSCGGYTVYSSEAAVTVGKCTHESYYVNDFKNNVCSICNKTVIALVTIDGKTCGRDSIAEAFELAQGKTAIINVTPNDTLPLGGVTVSSGTNITLNKSDSAYNSVLYVKDIGVKVEEGGTLILKNSEFSKLNDTGAPVTAIQVNGGTFIMETTKTSYGITTRDNAIVVSSGTVMIKPGGTINGTITVNEGTVGDLLEPGKGFKASDGSWADSSASSITGEFTIGDCPVKITAEPEDAEISKSENATLSVTAEGSGTITYQWYKVTGDTAEEISGATSDTYTTEGLEKGEYSFYCIVDCDGFKVRSRTAAVTVREYEYIFAAAPGKEVYDYGGGVEVIATVTGADADVVKEVFLYCGDNSLSHTSITNGSGRLSAQVSNLDVNDLRSELTVKFYTTEPFACVGEVSVTVKLNPCQHKGNGTPATCLKKAFCYDCGQEYGELGDHAYGSELNHDETNHWLECGVCGDKDVTAHDFGEGVVSTEPTCKDTGIRTFTCECGETKTETVPVTEDHTYNAGEITKAATCTETGIETFTCGVCGNTYTETIPVTAHDYRPEITTDPTADSEGVRTYTCNNCNDSYTESIPKLPKPDHQHEYTPSVTKAATCTMAGIKTYYCSCGDSYTETISATGHDYRSEMTTDPTADSEGVRTYTCNNCNDSYTESIPKLPKPDHKHNYTPAVTKAATCTEDGVKTYTCECGDSYTEAIPATGHDYRSEVTTEPTVDSEGVRTYTCNNCGDTYTESIPKLDKPTPPVPSSPGRPGRPSGSSGGSSSSGGSDNPIVDGKEMSWTNIANELKKISEGSRHIIELNGNTLAPAELIAEIASKDAVVTFVLNSEISFVVDGARISGNTSAVSFAVGASKTAISATNFTIIGGGAEKQFSLGSIEIPAKMSFSLSKANAGRFASLMKLNSETGRYEFVSAAKITADGTALVDMTGKGDYLLIVDTETKKPGDLNNDIITNAKDSAELLKSIVDGLSMNGFKADCNGDGFVNALDASHILKIAVGLVHA